MVIGWADGHYQAALVTGDVYRWFLLYNYEFQKNLAEGMSPEQAYYSLKDEREMYSFGPKNRSAQTNLINPVNGNYETVKW